MQNYDVKIKTYQGVWERDKELLEKHQSHIDPVKIAIDWTSKIPSNEDAISIIDARTESWRNPKETVQLDNDYLRKTSDRLMGELKILWSEKFKEKPDIEIIPQSKFLSRINEIEREVNAQLGYGDLTQSPPFTACFVSHGKLLFPEKMFLRFPKTRFANNLKPKDFDVIEVPWNKPSLEEELCEVLSNALFRQLRGEWRDDYVTAMKNIGEGGENSIMLLNSAITQYIIEVLIDNGHPQWVLHSLGNKIFGPWRNSREMDYYRTVNALLNVRNISQIAMIDEIDFSQGGAVLHFYPGHPYHLMKQEKFTEDPSWS